MFMFEYIPVSLEKIGHPEYLQHPILGTHFVNPS